LNNVQNPATDLNAVQLWLEEVVMSSSGTAHPSLKFAPPGAFARDLNRHARDALAGQPRHGDADQAACAMGVVAVGLTAYGWLLCRGSGWWIDAACIAVAAFAAFLLIVQIGHDASHGAVTSSPAIDRAMLFWSFAILGVDGALWRDRHLKLHHQVVNLPGTGIDADAVSLIRLMPDKPWQWWMRFQPLYGPLLYAVGHIALVWIEDLDAFRNIETRRARANFIAGKSVHVALFLLVPWLVLRPAPLSLAMGYLFASALIAICFVVLVIGTHVSALAEFPQPDTDGRLPHDWATHQVLTSVDWLPENRLAILLTGGANAHVAHHLFPGHSHRHAAVLSRVIAQTTAEYGLEHRVTSFAGMVAGQWRHLIALSRPPGPDARETSYHAVIVASRI
jgi:linoleoyl-CoA desaturase